MEMGRKLLKTTGNGAGEVLLRLGAGQTAALPNTRSPHPRVSWRGGGGAISRKGPETLHRPPVGCEEDLDHTSS